jgi:50S ribosomal subunit-associated GTPase HflX
MEAPVAPTYIGSGKAAELAKTARDRKAGYDRSSMMN